MVADDKYGSTREGRRVIHRQTVRAQRERHILEHNLRCFKRRTISIYDKTKRHTGNCLNGALNASTYVFFTPLYPNLVPDKENVRPPNAVVPWLST